MFNFKFDFNFKTWKKRYKSLQAEYDRLVTEGTFLKSGQEKPVVSINSYKSSEGGYYTILSVDGKIIHDVDFIKFNNKSNKRPEMVVYVKGIGFNGGIEFVADRLKD